MDIKTLFRYNQIVRLIGLADNFLGGCLKHLQKTSRVYPGSSSASLCQWEKR